MSGDISGETGRLDDRPLLRSHPRALQLSLVLWALGGALYVAMAVPSLAARVQGLDDRMFDLVVDLENTFFVHVAEIFDFLGSTWVTAPVMVIVGVFLIRRRRWEALTFWVLAMAASQALIGPVKAIYQRPRPPMPLVETSDWSFPSGHATAGAAIAVALVIVLVPAGPRRRNLEMLAAAFALVMAMTRVYLRAHWLTDTVAGAALGAAVAIGAAAAVQAFDERRHHP